MMKSQPVFDYPVISIKSWCTLHHAVASVLVAGTFFGTPSFAQPFDPDAAVTLMDSMRDWMEKQENDLWKINQTLSQITDRLDQLDSKMARLQAKDTGSIEGEIGSLSQQIDSLKGDVSRLSGKVATLEARPRQVETRPACTAKFPDAIPVTSAQQSEGYIWLGAYVSSQGRWRSDMRNFRSAQGSVAYPAPARINAGDQLIATTDINMRNGMPQCATPNDYDLGNRFAVVERGTYFSVLGKPRKFTRADGEDRYWVKIRSATVPMNAN